MKKIKTFTIDFNKWGQGYLLVPAYHKNAGKKCCLGFLATACGVADVQMVELETPANLHTKHKEFPCDLGTGIPYFFVDGNLRPTFKDLMDINDHPKMNKKRKMAKITKIFAEYGIAVKWKNVPKQYR